LLYIRALASLTIIGPTGPISRGSLSNGEQLGALWILLAFQWGTIALYWRRWWVIGFGGGLLAFGKGLFTFGGGGRPLDFGGGLLGFGGVLPLGGSKETNVFSSWSKFESVATADASVALKR